MTTEEKLCWRFIDALRDELVASYLDQGYTEEEAEGKATQWLSPEIQELRGRFGTSGERGVEPAEYIKIQGRRLRIQKDNQ
jgi:hypothetical protein